MIALVAFALVVSVVQLVALLGHLRTRKSEPRALPFVSVLKPLCGADDDLEKNLRSFMRQRYPAYEVLLGVKDRRDPAYPIAVAARRRWPGLVRVVVQQGAPGLNPKVNQLIGLARAAVGEIVVVSDSNIRVGRDYLRGIAAAFDSPGVGLVTHPVAGAGERTLGALLDNATMSGAVATGIVSAKRIARKDLVVGKSMALRSEDLHALGGFERLKDVLAEDFVSGQLVTDELRKRVAIVPEPVFNVARTTCLRAFFARYLRWSVMQRKAVGNATYAAQVFLHPVALAAVACAMHPSKRTAAALAIAVLVRAAAHEIAAVALRRRGFGAWALLGPIADLALTAAWLGGFARDEITWRGNRFRVCAGTVLRAVPEAEDACTATVAVR